VIGVVSFFADFTYEGARSVTGPFLATLGANGAIVGMVAGVGELFGYGLRLVSGTVSEKTQKFWPITLFGYAIQMIAVPLLAFAKSWQIAAVLIILERVGKATRNPPRDVMLSHAAKEIGYGWGFGIHEALDQSGALFGPLIVAAVLAHRGSYTMAFAVLVAPAIITFGMLLISHHLYPHPEGMEDHHAPSSSSNSLPRTFWIYLCGAALVAAGFADFQLIAFHLTKTNSVSAIWIPIAYSIAMAISGAASLLFGRLFDRFGLSILVPLTIISAAFAPLVFLGSFWTILAGAALWGLGMGVHESIIPAAVATIVPVQRRPSAYGIFTGVYGVAWFLGSAAMGFLYDVSLKSVVIFCLILQTFALFFFMKANATREMSS
jgi:MFS family permease